MIEVQVDVGPHPRQPEALAALLERAVRHALAVEEVAEAEVSLALVDDAEIQALNAAHLGHDTPTDVISFALHESGEPPLGDVYVGVLQARRQAAEAGVDEAEELVRLAVHGTLHVLGWDHPDDEDRLASAMWERQERVVTEVMRAGQ